LAKYNLNRHRYHPSYLCHDYHRPNEYAVLAAQDNAVAAFGFRVLSAIYAVSCTWIYLCLSKVDRFLLIDHRQNHIEATLFFLLFGVYSVVVDNFDELVGAYLAAVNKGKQVLLAQLVVLPVAPVVQDNPYFAPC